MKEERFSFREAAMAAGVTSKALRNWLDPQRNYGLVLDADNEREGGGWRRFSFLDVVRLSAIGTLVDYCVPVERAARMVESSIIAKFGRPELFESPSDVKAIVKGYVLYVWRDGTTWRDAVRPNTESCALLCVNFERIAQDIFERLGL